ncbi:MAG TPA: hypothetical protein VF147_10895 [Vicinamibacterales bacterium]
MEQRRLRLGDILDDYCPRERRVTNHAVVAMIDEDVKQTRCTTCDAEHVYKGGKAPRRKKSESTGVLYKEVLAGIEEPVARIPAIDEVEMADSSRPDEDAAPSAAPDDAVQADDVEDDDSQIHLLPPDDGPVHRPLIRAQLPRPEGMKVERQAPEFTIRQNTGRPGGFRGRGGHGGGNGNGNGHGGQRFGRGPMRSGQGGGGFNRGHGGGNQQRHGGGPRKRSR